MFIIFHFIKVCYIGFCSIHITVILFGLKNISSLYWGSRFHCILLAEKLFTIIQFLHVTLDLTGKHCPVIFSAVLFFVFEKFSWTSTGGKCALRWFYCLEKQKLSLERTPPGKKLRFCIRYLWKMKEKPANLNRGVCFSMKWKATCQNWAHLDEEKQFGLKSHLRASCTQT